MSDVYSGGAGFQNRIWQRFRLQFLGAGDWKAELSSSGLPDDVQALIRDIVQGTGLLRFEQSEICTELIHHFQDGHDRGRPYEELVRDFGGADVAVALFRSSKLRNRPVSVKAFRASVVVFFGGLIGYLALQVFFHAAKPNPTVDYIAELNDLVTSMPEEEKAWPLYRDVWIKHGLVANGQRFDELWTEEVDPDAPEIEWTNHTVHRRLIRPTDAGWDKAAEKLESLRELLEVLRKGSRRPYIGTPLHNDKSKYTDEDLAALYPGLPRELINENESLLDSYRVKLEPVSEEAKKLLSESTFSVLLPHIQLFRRAARILRVDTRYAMQQGDSERAIENVEAIFRLGDQTFNSPILICSLVGFAIRGIGFDLIEELAEEHFDNLSGEELQRLQECAARVDFADSFDLAFEKKMALDMIQRIFSDDGNGDGRVTAVGMELLYITSKLGRGIGPEESDWTEKSLVRTLIGPTQLFIAPSRTEMEGFLDEVFERIASNLDTRMWEVPEFDLSEDLKEKNLLGLFDGILVIPDHMKQAREIKIARQDAVLLALAIYRFKRANEQWPIKLDQLTDKWIDRSPIDRLSGKPLSFAIIDERPVVYSLGHDGVDDRGVPLDVEAPWLDRLGKGDWVLWPNAGR